MTSSHLRLFFIRYQRHATLRWRTIIFHLFLLVILRTSIQFTNKAAKKKKAQIFNENNWIKERKKNELKIKKKPFKILQWNHRKMYGNNMRRTAEVPSEKYVSLLFVFGICGQCDGRHRRLSSSAVCLPRKKFSKWKWIFCLKQLQTWS